MPYNKFPAVDENNKFPAPIRTAMALYTELIAAFAPKSLETSKADVSALNAHVNNVSNPHVVTKTQVGLGNVDNTSDVNKPASTAQKDLFVGHGTSTQRDTQYGIPSTTAEKADLANKVVVWHNTTTGFWQTYYATTGTTGLTAPGISGASGWYTLNAHHYSKITLTAVAGHTVTDAFTCTRDGNSVTIRGRFNRPTGNSLVAVGGLPVGYRPMDSAQFPVWWIGGNTVMGQINPDGSMATPFVTTSGDFMVTATFPTDPKILP